VPGFKLGRYHHLGEAVDPDRVNRECHRHDEQVLRAFAERFFPNGAGLTMGLQACLFTNTPDKHFILDLHPDFPLVFLVSPYSGHGFKFCNVVGEILTDLAERGAVTTSTMCKWARQRCTSHP
jgi:sarcosine oxidase